MGRPPKDPSMAGAYATRARAWLVCGVCDRSIPYAGNSDPEHGDGWPQHRCDNGAIAPFTHYTTTDPHPPPPLPVWEDQPATKPDIMIG